MTDTQGVIYFFELGWVGLLGFFRLVGCCLFYYPKTSYQSKVSQFSHFLFSTEGVLLILISGRIFEKKN
jgi:hypothetical protein